MKNNAPPCYDRGSKTDCPDRQVGCASTCEKWAAYVEVRDKEYETKKKVSEFERSRDEYYHKEAGKRYRKDRRHSIYK